LDKAENAHDAAIHEELARMHAKPPTTADLQDVLKFQREQEEEIERL